MSTQSTNSAPSPQFSSQTLIFDVGGKQFKFAKETFNKPYVKGSVFEIYANDRWESKEASFHCCDPEIFKKYIAPYIRMGVVPKWNQVKHPKVLLATADAFNLGKFVKKFLKSKYKIMIGIRDRNSYLKLKTNSKKTTQEVIQLLVEKNFPFSTPVRQMRLGLSNHSSTPREANRYRLKRDPNIDESEIEKLMPLSARLKDQGINSGDTLYVGPRFFGTDGNGYHDGDSEWDALEREKKAKLAASKSPEAAGIKDSDEVTQG